MDGDASIGSGTCTRTILDCSASGRVRQLELAGRPAVVFLDPLRPMTVPAVQCGDGGIDGQLVVFSGTACHLWRTDNVFDCFWDARAQARLGSALLATPPAARPSQTAVFHA